MYFKPLPYTTHFLWSIQPWGVYGLPFFPTTFAMKTRRISGLKRDFCHRHCGEGEESRHPPDLGGKTSEKFRALHGIGGIRSSYREYLSVL